MRQVREKAIALFEQGRVAEVIEPNAAFAFHPRHAHDAALLDRYLDFVLRAGGAAAGAPEPRGHRPARRAAAPARACDARPW